MRKILLSAVLIIAAASVSAQDARVENAENLRRNAHIVQELRNGACSPITVFPFFESLKNGIPACWLNIADGDGQGWMGVLPEEGFSGGAVSLSFGEVVDVLFTPDNWLITPELVLSANSYTLSFAAATLDPNFPAEHFSVLVSITDTDPSSFTTVIHSATLTAAAAYGDGGKTVILDLSAFSGESIYIAFRHWNTTNQFALVLSNVEIKRDNGTNLPANESADIRIFPNPVGSEMHIQTEQIITRVDVIDMQGRVVLQQHGSSRTVNMQSVASGIYTVQIHTEAGVVPIRIVKQ